MLFSKSSFAALGCARPEGASTGCKCDSKCPVCTWTKEEWSTSTLTGTYLWGLSEHSEASDSGPHSAQLAHLLQPKSWLCCGVNAPQAQLCSSLSGLGASSLHRKAPALPGRCAGVTWKAPPLVEWLHDQDFPQITSETCGLSVINVLAGRMDRLSLSSALHHTWEQPQGIHFNLDFISASQQALPASSCSPCKNHPLGSEPADICKGAWEAVETLHRFRVLPGVIAEMMIPCVCGRGELPSEMFWGLQCPPETSG